MTDRHITCPLCSTVRPETQFQITRRMALQLATDWGCHAGLIDALCWAENNHDLARIADQEAAGPDNEYVRKYLLHILRLAKETG